VSNQLPSREQSLKLLIDSGCSEKVVKHCEAVAQLALEIAADLKTKGYPVDLDLVLAGGLLHDLGRSKTHNLDHGIVGAKIAQDTGFPLSVVNIIKRHIGAGITPKEAQQLGWPKDNYVPQSLEEKVVCYADKLIDGAKKAPVELTIQQLQSENKPEAAERIRRLHQEVTVMLGHQA
jgi:uncharacterized protein